MLTIESELKKLGHSDKDVKKIKQKLDRESNQLFKESVRFVSEEYLKNKKRSRK